MIYKQIDKKIDKLTCRQIYRWIDRQLDKQTYSQMKTSGTYHIKSQIQRIKHNCNTKDLTLIKAFTGIGPSLFLISKSVIVAVH